MKQRPPGRALLPQGRGASINAINPHRFKNTSTLPSGRAAAHPYPTSGRALLPQGHGASINAINPHRFKNTSTLPSGRAAARPYPTSGRALLPQGRGASINAINPHRFKNTSALPGGRAAAHPYLTSGRALLPQGRGASINAITPHRFKKTSTLPSGRAAARPYPTSGRVSVMTIILFCMIALFGTLSFTQSNAGPIKAAALEVDVTPSYLPVRMAGSMRPNQATDIHDPLKARLFIIDNKATTFVIGTIDNCVIPREVFDAIKSNASAATGIPTSHMLLSATHTHSAPPLTGLFLNDPETDYIPELITKTAQGIIKAYHQLEPARVGWTSIDNDRHVFNRRWHLKEAASYENPFGSKADTVRMNPGYGNPDIERPAGPSDPEINILAAVRPDGSPICIYANYSLHYVGGVRGLSADYFGAFANELSSRLKEKYPNNPFVGILSNGASGDINNLNYGLKKAPPRKELYEQIRFVANDVAHSVLGAFQKMDLREDTTISIREREIQLGVRRAADHEWERIHRILEEAQKKDMSKWSQAEIYARESLLLRDFPDKVAIKLQAVRVGDFGIVSLPTETFVEIGLQLKTESPLKQQMVVELANGYNGYLPTPQQHDWGGYETWRARSSYLETESSPKIVRNLQEMLNELHP